MARRHYQKGSLIRKGSSWYVRWLDYTTGLDGQKKRAHRCTYLGTVQDFPLKKAAKKKADEFMAQVNSPVFKPRISLTFLELAAKWKNCIMPQHKPSSQNSEKVHLQRFKDYFGSLAIDQVMGDN